MLVTVSSGKISTKTLNKLKDANYYVIESNHDVEMLINSNRPWFLKKRILSDKGHLSNEQSATYMTKCVGENTKQIILAHLSEECNDPEVALKTYKKIFKDAKINTRKIKFIVANQYHSVEGGSK